MPVCTVRNTTSERVDLKLNNRAIVTADPGESTEVVLSGDQVGYLRAKGLEVTNPEERSGPPKGSKIALMRAKDKNYAGPLTGEERGATALLAGHDATGKHEASPQPAGARRGG